MVSGVWLEVGRGKGHVQTFWHPFGLNLNIYDVDIFLYAKISKKKIGLLEYDKIIMMMMMIVCNDTLFSTLWGFF